MNPTIWGAVAIVIAGLLGVWGSKIVSDKAQAAAKQTADMQANAGLASGYSLLTNDLRNELLRKDEERRLAIEELRSLVDGLRKDMDAMKRRYTTAITYVRLLLKFIADNLPEREPPAIPADLTLDLD